MSINYSDFDPEDIFSSAHVQQAVKRSADSAGMVGHGHLMMPVQHYTKKKEDKVSLIHGSKSTHQSKSMLSNGKKTKGRVKIKMEFIDNKLRRYTTFSKRKTGIMKKAYELSTLTGTQVMLLVASETGHVYTFATRKLQPMITSDAGKALIQTCLNSPDPPNSGASMTHDQRMSATGYEETELTYAVAEDDQEKTSPIPEEFINGNVSCSGSDSSVGPSPADTPEIPCMSPIPSSSENISHSLALQLPPGVIFTSNAPSDETTAYIQSTNTPKYVVTSGSLSNSSVLLSSPDANQPTILAINKANNYSGRSIFVSGPNSNMMYPASGGMGFPTSGSDSSTRLPINLPSGLHQLLSSDQDCRNPTDLMKFPMHLASAALQKSASSVNQSSSMQSLPTDLSIRIKKESKS